MGLAINLAPGDLCADMRAAAAGDS